LNLLKNNKLKIIVFISGASVMILELTGSRVLAPFVGTATSIWSTLIGIILGSMSLGYYYGGKLADRSATYKKLSKFLFISSVWIFFTATFNVIVLSLLSSLNLGLILKSVFSVLILFAGPSFVLGIVSPYAIKLKIISLENSGSDVGTIYAVSTIGSIFGTFLAGYVLIPLVGTQNILYTLAIILLLNSIFTNFDSKKRIFKIYFLLIYIFFILYSNLYEDYNPNFLLDIDTKYNRIWIYDYKNSEDKKIRKMQISNESSSSMYLDSEELVYDYTKYYKLIEHFNSDFQNTLMIGGAGYSFPKYYLKNYTDKYIDVVEIDSKVTDLAKKYFNLEENNYLNIIHEDGRTYLNSNTKKYDAILVDAYKSYYTIPYHLTTVETYEKIYSSLNENGVVIINIISSIEGEKSKFLQAEYRTIKEFFPQIYLIQVNSKTSYDTSNLILIALKNKSYISLENEDKELNSYLNKIYSKTIDLNYPIITDDYAPVDYYISDLY
jgi:spermidine synthase